MISEPEQNLAKISWLDNQIWELLPNLTEPSYFYSFEDSIVSHIAIGPQCIAKTVKLSLFSI